MSSSAVRFAPAAVVASGDRVRAAATLRPASGPLVPAVPKGTLGTVVAAAVRKVRGAGRVLLATVRFDNGRVEGALYAGYLLPA